MVSWKLSEGKASRKREWLTASNVADKSKNRKTENWQLDLAMDFKENLVSVNFLEWCVWKPGGSGLEEEREKKIDTSD